MQHFDRITALIFFSLSIGICIESVRISLGTFRHPGPGLISFLAGILMGLFSSFLYIKNIEKGKDSKKVLDVKKNHKMIMITVATLIIYAILFEILGFLVSNISFLIIIGRFVADLRWRMAILFAAMTSVVGYIVFGIWFQSPMPKWILEEGVLWIFRRISF